MLEAGIDPFQVFFEASNNEKKYFISFEEKNIFEYFFKVLYAGNFPCETDYILL